MNEREFGQEAFNSDQFLAGGITLLLSGLVGFVGNTLVLIITYRILRYRQSLPTVFTLFLAWVDFLIFPLAYPQSLIKYFFGVYVGNYMACDYQATVITFLYTLSIMLVVFMSIDRLLALLRPFYYGQYITYDKEKVKVTAIGLGTAVLTISLLPSFGVGRNVLHFPGTYCLFEWGAETVDGRALVYISMSFLAFALLLVAFCNLAVVVLVWRLMGRAAPSVATKGDEEQATREQVSPAENKGTVELQFAKLSCAVAVSFVGCWSLFLVSMLVFRLENFLVLDERPTEKIIPGRTDGWTNVT